MEAIGAGCGLTAASILGDMVDSISVRVPDVGSTISPDVTRPYANRKIIQPCKIQNLFFSDLFSVSRWCCVKSSTKVPTSWVPRTKIANDGAVISAFPIDWISLFSDYYLRLVVFIYFLEIGYDELPKYLRRFCLLSCFFRSIFDIRENQKSIYFLTIF